MVATNSYIEQDIQDFDQILSQSDSDETCQNQAEKNPYFDMGSIV
jgi:hypothetical protein